MLVLLLIWYLRRRHRQDQPDFESLEGPSFNPDAMVRSPTPIDRSSFASRIRAAGGGVTFTREVSVRPSLTPSGDGRGVSFNPDLMVRRSPSLKLNSLAGAQRRAALRDLGFRPR
jgi:hypothetical protein